MNDSKSRSVCPKLLLATSLCVSAVLLQAPAQGEIYKWTDAAGEVQYTQTPPPRGTESEEMKGAPTLADDPDTLEEELQDDVDAKDETLTKDVEAMDEPLTKEEGEAREKNLRKEIDAAYEKNCTASKNNLASLQEGGRKRYKTADGQVMHFSEEERLQRINEAKDQIDKYCK